MCDVKESLILIIIEIQFCALYVVYVASVLLLIDPEFVLNGPNSREIQCIIAIARDAGGRLNDLYLLHEQVMVADRKSASWMICVRMVACLGDQLGYYGLIYSICRTSRASSLTKRRDQFCVEANSYGKLNFILLQSSSSARGI